MKADTSDAPVRVMRRRPRRNVFYVFMGMVIGGIATLGVAQLTSRAASPELAVRQPMNPAASHEVPAPLSDLPPRQAADSSWRRASPETSLPTATTRQTVFNDENFTSRGAGNVIALGVGVGVGSDLPSAKEAPRKVQLTIIRQSPSMKDRACWPYKQGSIEARKCRTSIGLKHRD